MKVLTVASSSPLGSVDDGEERESDGHQEAVVQAQEHGRHKGHQPNGLREERATARRM